MMSLRPVGHITSLIRELDSWKKNRDRVNLKEMRVGRPLDSSTLVRAMTYLKEYRDLVARKS